MKTVPVVPVATAATGVGETSFTANWNAFAGASYYLLDVSTSSSFSSFVLQDQVVYTNSYAVTGLTSNTTYYYRLRASTTYDTDAEAFFTRVSSAGGSLTTTEQQAVNSLVIQMKANSLWTPMKAIYPMVGASAAACAQNLKSSSFTGTFTSGWTFASTGVTPNGAAYMDTGLNMLNNLTQNNSHVSTYSRTNIANAGSMMGVHDGSFGNSIMLYPNISGNAYVNMFSSGGTNLVGVIDTLGLRTVSRIVSTEMNFYNRATKTALTVTSVTGLNRNLFVGANNVAGAGANYDTRQNAWTSIGDGLSDTQVTNLNTAVQAFQTTLSRNV
jgi:hypothetical protein